MPASTVGPVSAALEVAGALAISLGDPGGEPILEPAPGATPLWGRVVVTALMPAGTAAAPLWRNIEAAAGTPPVNASTSIVEERDWVGEFRENLQPMRYGSRLWVCPEGSRCPDPAATVIHLDPGLAFGSGSHPTTTLCLEWLAGLDLAGRRLLDFGCGSGILAIAALALGAQGATALDIDPQALLATRDNARRNGCDARMQVADPAGLAADARFGIVVANILADTIIALAPLLARHCEAGARVALSGILSAQADRVQEACAPWLDLHLAAELDGWALLSGAPLPRR